MKTIFQKQHHKSSGNRAKLFISIGLIIIAIGVVFQLTSQDKSQQAQPIEISVVTIPVSYGETELTGTIRKDAQVGQDGFYFLVLNDDRLVLLEPASSLINDSHLGKNMTISGTLEVLEYNDDVVGVLIPKTFKINPGSK